MALRPLQGSPTPPRPRKRAIEAKRRGVADAPLSAAGDDIALADRASAPDAIFIGGGCDDAVLDAAIAALRGGGRLVVNAVTIETEALLIARQAARGGTLTRIAIERAEPLGGMTTWRPALPVTQWGWVKPELAA